MTTSTAVATPAAQPTSVVPSTPFASASLYVGDLGPEVTEALLFEIFNAVGPVSSVRVCRDAATRRSLGYAYVNFHRVEDAERALDTMNFTNIRGRPCRIMWSHRDPALRKSGHGNIFVKNLAKSIDNKVLYDTFSIFGNILSCKVATNSKRESLGYGFVHYESDDAAANAIARVNGMNILFQKVTVQPFKSKKDRGGSDKNKFTNLYVKNLPEDYTKEKLDELFSKYGTVTSSMIAMQDDKSKGFGFINFLNSEEAAAAVESLNNTELVPGKKLFVGRAQKKEEREKELRERFEQIKAERQKKYAGVNLFIKNLNDNIDDQRLIQEFSKFGEIKSACVMTDSTSGKSRGFGFVCFATPDEATKAVSEMNGKMLEGKPLYVALAQRKEVRRAQLEAQYAVKRQNMPLPQPMYPPQGTPIYYAPQAVPQRMMYPQPAMVPRGRWNPSQQAGGVTNAQAPQQGQARPGPALVPGMQYMNMAMPRVIAGQQRAPRGGPRGSQQQGGPKPGGRGRGQQNAVNLPNGNMPQQNANFKYTQQVRNQPVAGQMPTQNQPATSAQVPNPAAAQQGKVLTVAELAAAPEEAQKQIIGERLFPLIQHREPQLAGKITGMLLEMDNSELLYLLESHEALNEKIDEALAVLRDVDQSGDVDKEQAE